MQHVTIAIVHYATLFWHTHWREGSQWDQGRANAAMKKPGKPTADEMKLISWISPILGCNLYSIHHLWWHDGVMQTKITFLLKNTQWCALIHTFNPFLGLTVSQLACYPTIQVNGHRFWHGIIMPPILASCFCLCVVYPKIATILLIAQGKTIHVIVSSLAT